MRSFVQGDQRNHQAVRYQRGFPASHRRTQYPPANAFRRRKRDRRNRRNRRNRKEDAMNFNPDDPKWTAYILGELDASERAAEKAAIEELLESSEEARTYLDEL